MKTRIKGLLVVLILSSNILFGSSDGYMEFYKTYKSHEDITALDIPIFFARFFLSGEDNKDIRNVIKKTNDFKVFIAEESNYHLLPILKKSLNNASYNDAIIVSEENQIVSFKIKGDEELLTEIILIVDEIDSFVAIRIRGKFTPEDFRKFVSAMDT